ncbi:MAG: glycosyltransferase [Patescibacteria group bacterium]
MTQYNNSISVIIPVYNGEKLLRFSTKSAFDQLGKYINEIIIVDDGSTDDSWLVMQQISSEDKRVRIYQQKNQGQAKARNYGASMSKGEYLAFLDVDDTWKTDKLQKQLELFNSNDRLVLVYGNAEILFYPPRKEKITFSKITRLRRGNVCNWLLYKNFICTSSVIIKKNVFMNLGGFKENEEYRYIEDYDLWLRAAAIGPIDYIEEPLTCYLRHAAGSSQAKVKTTLNILKMIKKIPVDANITVINKIVALVRYLLVLMMYFFHLDRLFSPLD